MTIIKGSRNIRLFLAAVIIIALAPILNAQDMAQSFLAPLRAYSANIQNCTFQYDIEATDFNDDKIQTIRGTDTFTYVYPKIKVIRERSYNSGPLSREEFTFDGSVYQGLNASQVLYVGKNPNLFRFRIDLENPILLPLSFIFFQKNSHYMWNELYSEDTWLNLIKNCQLAEPESPHIRPKIRYAVTEDNQGNAVECIIEMDENNLPKKWHFTGTIISGETEIKSWKKVNPVPIPAEILFSNANKDGSPLCKATYRLKQYSQLTPALVPDNAFRISSELARIVVDCDSNATFSVPDKSN